MANNVKITCRTIERDDLVPCPFCGDNDPELIEAGGQFKILCNGFGCEAQYGWCASEELAINGWNARKLYCM